LRQLSRRPYSSTTSPYASTINNLRINSETRVIYQGFTGKQGRYVVSPVVQFPMLSSPYSRLPREHIEPES
jgi:succinyl-CoA synthetase alpha subunit